MHPSITLLLTLLAACCLPAQAEGIAQVLERSQQTRLDERLPARADSVLAQRIQASLARIEAVAPPPHPVELRVMQGGVQAEAMLGHLLVVGEAVGELPENERVMLLAHEYGHLCLDHWHGLLAMYERNIPGEVRPETTDPVARTLGREGRELSHRQEFEADAFGYQLARQLGTVLDDAFSVLMRSPSMSDTPTHPATRRRIAQLRAIQMRDDDMALHPEHGGPPLRAATAPTGL